jgi:Zinc knuckle
MFRWFVSLGVATDGEVSAADWFSEMFQQSNEALPHRWYPILVTVALATFPVDFYHDVILRRHRKPRVCFTCNQGGHLARDCPKQREEDRARKLSAFSGSSRGERSAHRGGLRGGGRGGFSGGVSVVLANSK